MADAGFAFDNDRLALRSTGALAGVMAEIDALEARLQAAPDWRPAAALRAELTWARGQLAQLANAWGSKLVVALVGPSGAGKSTLLNALAGRAISPVGLQRPTTRHIVAYVADRADIAGLEPRWGDTPVEVQVAPGAPSLAHLVLVDAPDTNTTPEGLAALARVLETADIVLAVFAAHNPRLHDNIAFLAPFVRRLPTASVVPVVNMVDRAPLQELEGEVLPDLAAALRREWHLEPERIYLVSARASLGDATYPVDEQPLHDVNEFGCLRAHLFEALNRASQVVDRRVARARRLSQLLQDDLDEALDTHRQALVEARAASDRFGQALSSALRGRLLEQHRELRGLDLHAALYSRMSARWWGPIGWVLAVWGLLVRATAWLSHLGARRSRAEAHQGELALDLSALFQAVEQAFARGWPPVADSLDRAAFAGPREPNRARDQLDEARETLASEAAPATEHALDESARRLAHPLLQIALNGPVLALLGWTGYQAVASFIAGQYLPQDYFQNAGVAILSVWAACFILLQVVVSLAVRNGVRRRIARGLAEIALQPAEGGYQAQIDALLNT